MAALAATIERSADRLLAKIGGEQPLIADKILRSQDKTLVLILCQRLQAFAHLVDRQVRIVIDVLGDGCWIDR
ncbi:hypothetical protein NS355_03340 [Sphingomonas yabuuchiae]|uniref:Uncharacterized protein n=1 Tax=Sphingomonas yabuuchiae TaxID=172044 RepID=A0A147IXZ3_9SPHN|nr:hypothetical protein NS355_03340 [Sphingomonas yabuuchiae]